MTTREQIKQEPEYIAAAGSLRHPVGICVAEHHIILDNLTELAEIVYRIGRARGYTEIQPDIKRLGEISRLLLATESHHQREEQALFPRLEKRGVTGPPRVMREEHVELRARKHRLAGLLQEISTLPFTEFVNGVQESGGYLAANLRAHIFKEDNVLYPTAMSVFSPEEWQAVEKDFDRIGYCDFTPGK